jgi:hypothetical protein
MADLFAAAADDRPPIRFMRSSVCNYAIFGLQYREHSTVNTASSNFSVRGSSYGTRSVTISP